MKPVSFVIPNYKKNPLIKHLPKIIKACPKNSEIIVVDDCSPDDTTAYLKKHFSQVKVISNKVNQRFAQTCNIGIKAAKNNLVFLLNSDVVPKLNFLKPLIKHFNDPKMFAVNCLEIQTVNGKREISGKNKCQFKRGLFIHQAVKITNLNQPTKNCWASGGSMMLDKKKFLQVGGFDLLYKPAYWEDIDLSWIAREKYGYKIMFEPRSQVFHNHETTNITIFGKRKIKIMSARNQLLFIWKNIRGFKLLQHFIWLPYHLIFTNIRSQGVFLISLLQAIKIQIKK
ncbi:MAG: glycosyltransferase family 2 protein [Patescibacteria group bacterium]|nr:glycosyltransferase family 2 protein [Patescibacteria group bacterium]